MPLERSRSAKLLSWKAPTRSDGRPVKIGVGITVQNREEVSDETIKHWRALLPKEAVLIVVDDASAIPYPDADYRFEQSVGIARAKNKCFELLEDLGVDEFFLSDNDFYPTARDWWKPYVNSPEPHLSYQFLDLVGPVKLHDMKILHRDRKHTVYSGQRGCLLYYNKVCLEKAGGFDPIYGRALWEHSDLANRIHHAGLTTWRYADVTDSHKLWHSRDEHGTVNRSISSSELQSLIAQNVSLHNKRRADGYKGFVPYREDLQASREVLITSLLTNVTDPQRGYKWKPDAMMISPWLESVERGGWDGVVLADELRTLPKGYSSELVHVEPCEDISIYIQRWMHIYQYLRANPDIKWVWCTDGSDVEVLRNPFKEMALGKLYVGTENKTVNIPWMVNNHPEDEYQRFFKKHGRKILLNAGVVGGDRETVMEFVHKVTSTYFDIETNKFFAKDERAAQTLDMGPFNKVAYEQFESRLVYGPQVTTEFKKYEDNGTAKFKHK